MKSRKLPTLAAGVAIAMGAAGQATAGVYAVSFLDITNLFVNITPPGNVNNLPLTSADKSFSSAQLNNGPTASSTTAADAAVSFGTPGATIAPPANNSFTQQGPSGDTYSYADAFIPFRQTNVIGIGYTEAQQLAETELEASGVQGTTNTENSSNTSVSTTVAVAPGTVFNFTFAANAYLRAKIDPIEDPGPPLLATASYQVLFTITDNSSGANVFNWSPDGAVGGITGGSELADAFNLNDARSLGFPNTDAIVDPNGLGVAIDGTGTLTPGIPGATPVFAVNNFYGVDTYPAGWGLFGASSSSLGAGLYTLKIEAFTTTNAERVAVPEPASLALIGLGLVGLTGLSRRRRRIKNAT